MTFQDNLGELVNDNISEDTPLIVDRVEDGPSRISVWARRYRTTRRCVSAKAALLILLWSCPVALLYGLGVELILPGSNIQVTLTVYGTVAFIWSFFPLAGFLADVKFGRYKTVFYSSLAILIGVYFPLVLPFSILLGFVTLPFNFILGILIGCVIFSPIIIPLSIVGGYVGFTANIIQFGMDQLHDSPGEDRTLFIHWYWWVYYASISFSQLVYILSFFEYVFFITSLCVIFLLIFVLLIIVLLIISMCLGHHKRRWFLIEPGSVNPYKLVYRVTKFSCQHRIPVQRSAFTYCEDELPSGLDLGKDKYGGPFNTEEVEDVKAFYGILKVLLSFGPVFLLDTAANSLRYCIYIDNILYTILASNKPSSILIVLCIPLYLLLLRPFISHYIPGMLRRMGIGMFMIIISLVLVLSVAIVPDYISYPNGTMLCSDQDYYETPSRLITTSLVMQNILSALSNMLIYISVVEFICSQSPSSMTGLLIGVLYAIKGLFQLVATALVIPFISHGNRLSYSLVNIVMGVVSFVVYVCVARRYKYRERDEPCNIRQYAEEYYSNPQQERHYDYD